MRPGPSPFALFRLAQMRRAASLPLRRNHMSTPGAPSTPPLSKRLKALLPFLFWWSVITSLATHRLQLRHRSTEELGVVKAQITVLESLIARVQQGVVLSDDDVRRELEMVGLRERTILTESEEERLFRTRDVTWGEAFFGRKMGRTPEEEERNAVEGWSEIVREASDPRPAAQAAPAATTSSAAARTGAVRRAPSATVYL